MPLTKEFEREMYYHLVGILGDGVSKDPREWSLADTTFLLAELGTDGASTFGPGNYELARTKGYEWRDSPHALGFGTARALRMDAYARLNEIHRKIDAR